MEWVDFRESLFELNIEFIKLVKDIEIISFQRPYNSLEEARLALVAAVEVEPSVKGELIVAQEPILRHAFAHVVDLQVLKPKIFLSTLKFFQGQISQLRFISESIEIVVH